MRLLLTKFSRAGLLNSPFFPYTSEKHTHTCSYLILWKVLAIKGAVIYCINIPAVLLDLQNLPQTLTPRWAQLLHNGGVFYQQNRITGKINLQKRKKIIYVSSYICVEEKHDEQIFKVGSIFLSLLIFFYSLYL